MANPVCDTATLAEVNPGFGLQGFNHRQYEAAMIYFMVRELAANGGTDYSSSFGTDPSPLISAATTFIGRADVNQRRIMMLQIMRNNAVSSGAVIPADSAWSAVNTLTAQIQSETVDFDAVILFLLCQLGRHADYPQ